MDEKSKSVKRSPTLITLCILTIIGSLLILLKGAASYTMLQFSNDDRSNEVIAYIDLIYALDLLTGIGAIVGAVLMISGKKMGLHIYRISTILYIVLSVAFACFCILTVIGIVIGVLQFILLLPTLVFLGLYQKQEKYLS